MASEKGGSGGQPGIGVPDFQARWRCAWRPTTPNVGAHPVLAAAQPQHAAMYEKPRPWAGRSVWVGRRSNNRAHCG